MSNNFCNVEKTSEITPLNLASSGDRLAAFRPCCHAVMHTWHRECAGLSKPEKLRTGLPLEEWIRVERLVVPTVALFLDGRLSASQRQVEAIA